MKWCKRLSFLPCCLSFLTHSGNENLYQSSLGGACMNHQTIYSGKCHYHGSSIQESSSQKKQGHPNLGKLVAIAGLVPIFLGNYVARINTHASVSIQITGPSTSGFSSKTDELTLHEVLLQCYWSPS